MRVDALRFGQAHARSVDALLIAGRVAATWISRSRRAPSSIAHLWTLNPADFGDLSGVELFEAT